jgi:hypothetical protein
VAGQYVVAGECGEFALRVVGAGTSARSAP